jgi:hypothetical protein
MSAHQLAKTQTISANKLDGAPMLRLPRSPVTFSVYHGQVLEVQSAQVPAVYGAGRSFLGCGSSYVETAIVRNTSVWTREHATGRETCWELGEADLPMRPGHEVSFLWANASLYALHNHCTRQTHYLNLPRSLFPFRLIWFEGFFGLIRLLLVALLALEFLPFLISMSVLPIFLLVGRMDIWPALPRMLLAINPYLIPFLVIFCLCRNWRARAYNWKLESRIKQELQDAVHFYLFGYSFPARN